MQNDVMSHSESPGQFGKMMLIFKKYLQKFHTWNILHKWNYTFYIIY